MSTHPVIRAILEQVATQMGLTYDALEKQWHIQYGPRPYPRLSEQERHAAEEGLFQHIGAVSLGYPLGADNESIDADLAREYVGRHEDED